MTYNEIRNLLEDLLPRETMACSAPTSAEWEKASQTLNTVFPKAFQIFVDLMAEFAFPGDIYNIGQQGTNNGNDTMELVYGMEVEGGQWPQNLLPFYGIGNGDYFALERSEDGKSAVYYWNHETAQAERTHENFEEWLRELPAFLED